MIKGILHITMLICAWYPLHVGWGTILTLLQWSTLTSLGGLTSCDIGSTYHTTPLHLKKLKLASDTREAVVKTVFDSFCSMKKWMYVFIITSVLYVFIMTSVLYVFIITSILSSIQLVCTDFEEDHLRPQQRQYYRSGADPVGLLFWRLGTSMAVAWKFSATKIAVGNQLKGGKPDVNGSVRFDWTFILGWKSWTSSYRKNPSKMVKLWITILISDPTLKRISNKQVMRTELLLIKSGICTWATSELQLQLIAEHENSSSFSLVDI